jgi:hypothetical protein
MLTDAKLDEFRPIQLALAQHFSTDGAVGDLPRLMRVPGTLHLKNPASPQLVRMKLRKDARRYRAAELSSQLPWGSDGRYPSGRTLPERVTGPAMKLPTQVMAGENGTAAGHSLSWFDRLHNEEKNECLRQMLEARTDIAAGGREAWLKVLMAAHASGASDAERLARSWSATDSQHTDNEFDTQWASFARSRDRDGVTVGTLIKLASERGFDSALGILE